MHHRKLSKHASSLYVTIPQEYAAALSWRVGMRLLITIDLHQEAVIITTKTPARYANDLPRKPP